MSLDLKATYDPSVNALYIQIGPDLAPGEQVSTRAERSDTWNVDYDQHGKIHGYEFLLTEPLETLGP